jgi:hypothetical protein
MTDTLIAVKPEIAAKALIDGAKYNAMYAAAAKDPKGSGSRRRTVSPG